MNAPLRVFYGGSFDPVHNGHLAVARAARDALDARVLLVPAGDPPHKSDTCASAEQRARMLDLAIEGEPGLAVDRRELLRAGPSYTVDTPVRVGTVLPESGVTYYDVPQQYGATSYRYTVVNDRPILVEPRTRRVMQVID